jgi:hypothetical protein
MLFDSISILDSFGVALRLSLTLSSPNLRSKYVSIALGLAEIALAINLLCFPISIARSLFFSLR